MYVFLQLLCSQDNSSTAVLSMRPLWLQLCRLVVRSGDALSLAQGTLLVFEFTYILVCSYYLLLISDLNMRLVLSGLMLMCTAALVTICSVAHQANVQVYELT